MTLSTEIHPVFQGVPDEQTALALSEYYVHSELFIRSSRGQYAEFPPEPSYTVGATIAFLDSTGEQEVVRRKFLYVDTDTITAKTAVEFTARYDTDVKLTQEELEQSGMPLATDFMEKAMLQPVVELAREAGLRTIGSFILMQSVNGERFYHGFVIPRIVYDEMPLLFRQHTMNMIKEFDAREGENKTKFPKFTHEAIDAVKQNAPGVQEMGFTAASLHMSDHNKVAHIVRTPLAGSKAEAQDNGSKMTRQQRRAKEKFDRKNQRNNPNI